MAEAIATGSVRVVTNTPELAHSISAMQTFACTGIRVSIGHTITDHAGRNATSVWSVCLAECVMGNRLLFVTDAMRGTGESDGPSQLGGQDVLIRKTWHICSMGHSSGVSCPSIRPCAMPLMQACPFQKPPGW